MTQLLRKQCSLLTCSVICRLDLSCRYLQITHHTTSCHLPMLVMKPTPSYYTDEQLAKYLEHIGLPSTLKEEPSLDNAERIIRHHITTIPFENTEMHYTTRGHVDSDPQAIFTRIVEDKKGGTICHGQHLLLLGMLLKLGYSGYNVMARMNHSKGDPNVINLTGLEHQVILMQIPGDEETYFVDVGLGLGVSRPAPLKADYEFDGIPPSKYRFTRGYHPDSPLSGLEAEEWRFQMNRDLKLEPIPDPGWLTFFQFSTQPAYLKDIMEFNWLTHNRPGAMLPNNILATVFTGKKADEPLEQMTIFGDRFQSRAPNGPIVLLKMFESEEERISALKEFFGIGFPADAMACIVGRSSAVQTGKGDRKLAEYD
ncbi:N-terminal acetyltransferase [Tulasnella sp. JGI-2019a]|nr:N-terminal acetyltransferase [Tulasnella sp. JGI-2019a]